MDYANDEPDSPREPRPCSTPHSAPVGWLRYDPELEPATESTPAGDPSAEENPALPLAEVAEHLRSDPEALAEFIASLAPEGRRDGWTPFARKLFLQVLADTSRVGLALACTGLSRQSANALRNRDPLFAAGWDAAALMARRAMADEFAEKSLDGIVETVTRNGEVVAERRRFDTRLSIAVLHRLDKHCERAEQQGSAHLAVMRRWDEWLDAIGKGDEAAARAILDSPPHGQFGQLAESANPTEIQYPPGCDPYEDPFGPCWQAGSEADLHPKRERGLPEGTWMTTFPPPPGYDGYENCPWDGDSWYERACTPEEAELLDAHPAAMLAQDRAETTAYATAERDRYFARLRDELSASRGTAAGPFP